MREDTIGRKKASRLFQELRGRRWLLGRMLEVISEGKRGLDGLALDLGRMVAEAVMYLIEKDAALDQSDREQVLYGQGLRRQSQAVSWQSDGSAVVGSCAASLRARIQEGQGICGHQTGSGSD